MSEALFANYVTPDTINVWYALSAKSILPLTTPDDPESKAYLSTFTLSESFEIAVLDIRSIIRNPWSFIAEEPIVIVPNMSSFPVLMKSGSTFYADKVHLTTTSTTLTFNVDGSSGYVNAFSMLLYIMR